MNLTGAEIITGLLERQGIEIIAGIPGGSNLPLYNALYKSKIRHILTRHEQGAGFIAQGMARSTGKAAVCFATSGPGATNLITAIADAKLDSVPIIAITGQVPTSLIGTDAFQEVDMYGMTIPITKHNFLIRSPEELFQVIPEAFRIAVSGRPGPVVIDIPKDVQQKRITFDNWPDIVDSKLDLSINNESLEKAAEMIISAKRPVLYIGGGIIQSEASGSLYELAHKNSIPVASTLMGLGAFPCDDPLYLGMLGMHGSRATNRIIHECDLLIVLGARFDDRATGMISQFCPDAKVIHVDIDSSEINKLRTASIAINADSGQAIKELAGRVPQDFRKEWINYISDLKNSTVYPPESDDPLHPTRIIRSVAALADSDAIITTDVGQHQMWVAQSFPFRKPRTLLTSGGLGTMGFGLPAAIGAGLANPSKQVICFSGDGSLLMNIQELATLADLGLNVKVIILNNGHLGLVRQQQELFFEGNYIASRFISNPDFIAIAKGFGIESFNMGDTSEFAPKLSMILSKQGPSLINIPVHHGHNVFPMVPPGSANHQMIGE
jgi:acetolactate synthase-1/2/3 large subunit